MRIFAVLLIAVAFVAIMIQRDAKNTDQTANKPVATLASTKAASSPSAHNWPKNALDRANDVKRQVVAQRQSNSAN